MIVGHGSLARRYCLRYVFFKLWAEWCSVFGLLVFACALVVMQRMVMKMKGIARIISDRMLNWKNCGMNYCHSRRAVQYVEGGNFLY